LQKKEESHERREITITKNNIGGTFTTQIKTKLNSQILYSCHHLQYSTEKKKLNENERNPQERMLWVEWCDLCEHRARILKFLSAQGIDSADRFLVRIDSVVELILGGGGGEEGPEVDSRYKNSHFMAQGLLSWFLLCSRNRFYSHNPS
jgi:hypothetical protein